MIISNLNKLKSSINFFFYFLCTQVALAYRNILYYFIFGLSLGLTFQI